MKTQVYRTGQGQKWPCTPSPTGGGRPEREFHSLWWSGHLLSHRLSWLHLLEGSRRPGQGRPTTFPEATESPPMNLPHHLPPPTSSPLCAKYFTCWVCILFCPSATTTFKLDWPVRGHICFFRHLAQKQTSPLRLRPHWQKGRARLRGEQRVLYLNVSGYVPRSNKSLFLLSSGKNEFTVLNNCWSNY